MAGTGQHGQVDQGQSHQARSYVQSFFKVNINKSAISDLNIF